jgi:predicted amidohydrolase
MQTQFQISIAQMDVLKGQPKRNIARVKEYVQKSAEIGSNLLLLPELWSTGYDLDNAMLLSSSLNSGIFTDLAEMSKQYQIYIGGTSLESLNGTYYNTFTIHDPSGNMIGYYHKTHLFKLMEEDKWLKEGNSIGLCKFPCGLAGLAICYDLRFPELFRKYTEEGTLLILLSAEWPKSRIMHWKILLQARAIENQTYVIGVNRVGVTDDEIFGGHSLVIAPDGKILLEGDENEELLTIAIDADDVSKTREGFFYFNDRNITMYR